MTIASVQKILAHLPESIGTDLFRRDAIGLWPERPQVINDGHLTLDSIGYTGPVAAFYRNIWLRQT